MLGAISSNKVRPLACARAVRVPVRVPVRVLHSCVCVYLVLVLAWDL